MTTTPSSALTPELETVLLTDPLDEYTKEELDAAAISVAHEQHMVSGIGDDVKAMFLWVETAEERAKKNRGE